MHRVEKLQYQSHLEYGKLPEKPHDLFYEMAEILKNVNFLYPLKHTLHLYVFPTLGDEVGNAWHFYLRHSHYNSDCIYNASDLFHYETIASIYTYMQKPHWILSEISLIYSAAEWIGCPIMCGYSCLQIWSNSSTSLIGIDRKCTQVHQNKSIHPVA